MRRLRRGGVCSAVALVLVGLAGQAAHAQRYLVHTYTEAEGLPSSDVSDIVQAPDGRMWFATRSAIAAYDGFSWAIHALPSGVPAPGVDMGAFDGRGVFWSAFERGPLRLRRFDGEAWTAVVGPDRFGDVAPLTRLATSADPSDPVVAVAALDGSIYLWDETEWHAVRTEPPVQALEIEGDRVWVVDGAGVSGFRFRRAGADSFLRVACDDPILGIGLDAGGPGPWIAGTDWIGRIEEGELIVHARGFHLPVDAVPEATRVRSDGRGGVYVGYVTGLWHYRPGRGVESLGVENGLVSFGASAIRVDREGNAWIGTRRGVSKIVTFRFAAYGEEHGLFEDEVSAILERTSGEIVFGHPHGLTFFGDEMRTVGLPSVHRLVRVLDMDEDESGTVWIAVEGMGLAWIDDDLRIHWVDGFGGDTRSVRFDGNRLWAAVARGVFVRSDGQFTRVDGPPLFSSNSIRRLFTGRGGALFLATSRAGVYRLRGGKWDHWVSESTPDANNVYSGLETPDGTILVGTGHGLYRAVDGKLVPSADRGARVERPVYFLTRDHDDRIWIGTDNGVMRRDPSGRLLHFTVEDGLLGRETNRAAGVVDSANRVWIGTERGVTAYRGEHDRRTPPPPPVRWVDLETPDGTVSLTEPLELRHGDHDLAFRFRAISFRDESRIRVRTWLEGLEPGWSPARVLRESLIRYTHLPAGDYRLHIQAANAEGVWGEEAISPSIVIRGPFWTRPWFSVLGLALFAAVAYSTHRYASQRRYATRLEHEVQEKLIALRASEERLLRVEQAERRRLEVTLGGITDGVIATDAGGRVAFLNPAAQAMTGTTPDDVIGQPLAEVLALQTPDGAAIDLSADPHAGGLDALFVSGDEQRLLEISGAPIQEDGQEPAGTVLAFRDVTDRRRIEEELSRTERLEALGLLAGGIAHDFNNLMTVILGNLMLIKFDSAVEEGSRTNLANAETAILRARDLTLQLLTFSRGGAPVREAASISEVVHESASFVTRLTSVRAEIDLAPDLWVVDIDPGQMNQVINNLLINAIESMPRGGIVHIGGRNVNHPALLPRGRFVEIMLRDEGHGIAPEHLDRIFDPYFSTKQRGSGLGLATAYSIVNRHEGLLTVESPSDGGTIFRIFLPASCDVAARQVVADTTVKGSGDVLVMDDERQVRAVIGELLARLGYRVDLVADGDEALAAYRRGMDRDRPYDVVIMDLTIPGGMGGREAVERLLEIDPGARAIVVSGYSNDPVMAEYERYGFRGCLVKPFQREQLARVVRRVMEPGDRTVP